MIARKCGGMTLRKGGRPKLPAEKRRIRIAPTLPPEAVEALRTIARRTGESQAAVLERLLLRELKRVMRLEP